MASRNQRVTLQSIINRVSACFENEDRKDELFRLVLVTNEVGDWAKFLTHDPKLNPNARPIGNEQEEILAAGQAVVMLLSLMLARNLSIEEVIEVGIKNWEDADWRKRQAQQAQNKDEIAGISACPGHLVGRAYIVSKKNPIEKMPAGRILIASSASPELAMYFQKAIGIVTDHGGKTSHAANIAREYNIPCIVGTGNATERIPHGIEIEINSDAQTEKATIKILAKPPRKNKK